jgi:hypothetical protein
MRLGLIPAADTWGDITSLIFSSLLRTHMDWVRDRGAAALWTASYPCEGTSFMGLMESLDNAKTGLLRTFLLGVMYHLPEAVILENTPWAANPSSGQLQLIREVVGSEYAVHTVLAAGADVGARAVSQRFYVLLLRKFPGTDDHVHLPHFPDTVLVDFMESVGDEPSRLVPFTSDTRMQGAVGGMPNWGASLLAVLKLSADSGSGQTWLMPTIPPPTIIEIDPIFRDTTRTSQQTDKAEWLPEVCTRIFFSRPRRSGWGLYRARITKRALRDLGALVYYARCTRETRGEVCSANPAFGAFLLSVPERFRGLLEARAPSARTRRVSTIE